MSDKWVIHHYKSLIKDCEFSKFYVVDGQGRPADILFDLRAAIDRCESLNYDSSTYEEEDEIRKRTSSGGGGVSMWLDIFDAGGDFYLSRIIYVEKYQIKRTRNVHHLNFTQSIPHNRGERFDFFKKGWKSMPKEVAA